MSELNDYLDGKITFEEFERRREEGKAKDKAKLSEDEDEAGDQDEATPSTSKGRSKRSKKQTDEGVSASVQKAFASMIGEGLEEEEDEDECGNMEWNDKEEEDGDDEKLDNEDDGCGITPGDVFALEMELNRENKKMMKERRHRSKLPRALRGLMGEANIRYARGDKEDAILMCMEIIRQALQFGLIAAHLNPSDCEEWVKLADLSLEQDNIKQAIICYTKAIKYDNGNVQYIWERSNLYEQVGEHKQAMDGYRRILSLLPPTDGAQFMLLSRDMAKSYYESNELASAIGVMEEALERHPELVSHEIVNMAAELFIANHQHDKALEALLKFCGIVLKIMDRDETETKRDEETSSQDTDGTKKDAEEEKGQILEVTIPEEVPIDIKVKMMVCLIHQHVFAPLDPLLTSLMEQSPEELGDLYLDVAEAFMEEGEYNSALPLLSALVCSERYNLAVVWLRHAECLKALCHLEVAVNSYNKVVEMAPLHLEARLALSTLQQQLGHPIMALQALEPMYDAETLAHDSSAAQQELKLLLHRSALLHSQGRTDDYIDSVFTMLTMLLKVAMVRAQVCLVADVSSGVKHLKLIKVPRNKLMDIPDQEAAYLDVTGKTSVLSKDDWWSLLLRCLAVLCEVNRFEEAELLVDSSLEYYSFYDDRVKRKELEYLGLSAAFLDHNFRKAYDYIRLRLMDNVECPQLWNVFNQVTLQSQDARHHRFCLRLLLKHPENHALGILNGHTSLVSGTFKHALGQYMQAFKHHPNSPLNSLLLGLTFLHMACQKFVTKRHPLVVQGIDDDQVDLRREIAYNLSLIYQSSGNMNMARHVIYTYCVV
ncbi:hypothetical protein DNTS_032255 [Danionella cerebrum]|uniref:General transcription factor 3C polypeptide 3 n=1 Tax=Danionella cerebrum TaxID=2873325 RepID=A0A553RDC9_9TELE|nr:hypothetical protein DNTS_032255 [Danionella translucida]